MGIPSAQVAQSINQQQPAPQGKGGYGNAPVGPAANMQQVDDTMQQIMPAVMPQPQVMPQQPQGKGFAQQVAAPEQQPQQQFGKGGTTNSATSGQPRMGRSNPYSNTIQPWDNASIQTQSNSGKGKGH